MNERLSGIITYKPHWFIIHEGWTIGTDVSMMVALSELGIKMLNLALA